MAGLGSKLKSSFIVQLFIPYFFVLSGLIVNIFQLFTLVVFPFNKLLYRKLNYYLSYAFRANYTSLIHWWCNTNVEIYVDDLECVEYFKPKCKDNPIAIMNHTYTIDWILSWAFTQNIGMIGGLKSVFKSSLKYLPVIGWSWIFSENIFVKRNWDSDKKIITKTLHDILEYPKDLHFAIAILCEATRFTEKKYETSIDYAKQIGIAPYKHHLVPRTKGFNLLANEAANKVTAIYDITLAVGKIDGVLPNIFKVLCGHKIDAKLFFRRIPIEKVPLNDEQKCSEFIYDLYRKKDEVLDCFNRTGDFVECGGKRVHMDRNRYDLYWSLFWIAVVLGPTLYYFVMFLLYGSLFSKLMFFTIFFTVNAIANAIIKHSTIERSSSFGLKKKN